MSNSKFNFPKPMPEQRKHDVKLLGRSKRNDRVRIRRKVKGPSVEPTPKDNSMLKAVIMDNGASTIKFGLSYDFQPQLIPNCIMKAKSERKRLFIGEQISECRDCSGLFYLLPCERGYIAKWDVQKPIWDHIFTKKQNPINDMPLVLTQPILNFKSIQECMDEIFFEEYEVASMCRVNPTDLAKLKYSSSNVVERRNCVIVDSGFSFTHVVPYIDDLKYMKATKRINVGGKFLTNFFKDILSYRHYNVMDETYVINQVKEDTCYVTEYFEKDLNDSEKPIKMNDIVENYVLPDFNRIRRGYIQPREDFGMTEENCQILRLNNERFVVPEVLFNPSNVGMKSVGIAGAVVQSIKACPIEKQKQLAKNIVLVGGNCKFPGFKDRMSAEVRKLLPITWDVNVFEPDDPIWYNWSGGLDFLKLDDVNSLLVTKAEYDELGSARIQQKFNNWMTFTEEEKPASKLPTEVVESYLKKLKSEVSEVPSISVTSNDVCQDLTDGTTDEFCNGTDRRQTKLSDFRINEEFEDEVADGEKFNYEDIFPHWNGFWL